MKILVVRLSSIGDIVLTTPVLRCLKEQLPGVEIHYLCKAAFAEVLAANPYIDKHYHLDDSLSAVTHQLTGEQYDVVIDLHRNIRTAALKEALAVKKTYTFNKLNAAKWLLVNFKIDILPPGSIVDRYMDTVRPLGVKNDGRGLDYHIPESAKTKLEDIPMGHLYGYVACVVGGSYSTKRLPEEKWAALIEKCSFPIVIMGGPEDNAMGLALSERFPGKVYNACGKFSLSESADLISRARVVVTNDTGLMHIAAAFQKPIISLWGNTDPRFGMFPNYGSNDINRHPSPLSTIMEVSKLRCHPCSKLGYDKCPRGHFKCMNLQDMTAAASQIVKHWK